MTAVVLMEVSLKHQAILWKDCSKTKWDRRKYSRKTLGLELEDSGWLCHLGDLGYCHITSV